MTKISCKDCFKCCGKIGNMRPVLIPSEEEKFKKFCSVLKNPYHNLYLLKRKKDGYCVFLDRKKKKCKIYDERPFDCRIFPFNLDLTAKGVKVILDEKVCPKRNEAGSAKDKKEALKLVKKLRLPKDYREAFDNTLKWY